VKTRRAALFFLFQGTESIS